MAHTPTRMTIDVELKLDTGGLKEVMAEAMRKLYIRKDANDMVALYENVIDKNSKKVFEKVESKKLREGDKILGRSMLYGKMVFTIERPAVEEKLVHLTVNQLRPNDEVLGWGRVHSIDYRQDLDHFFYPNPEPISLTDAYRRYGESEYTVEFTGGSQVKAPTHTGDFTVMRYSIPTPS